jgi:isoquinoline 1-oxidoreductase beta subunit
MKPRSDALEVGRRGFLVGAGGAGVGLVLGLSWPASSARAGEALEAEGAVATARLNPFVQVSTDGTVTLWASKSEMGQGVRTSLPMILAEELEADWRKVRVEQADAWPGFGDQETGGSSSVRSMWMPLRQAGAAAREMLVSAAASTWGVSASECAAREGVVTHKPTGRKLTYGELAARAATLPVPKEPALKPAGEFRIVGTKPPRVDAMAIVTGTAGYSLDVRRPGMLYASVARSPVFGGRVKSFDPAAAKAVRGVKQVVELGPAGKPVFREAGVAVIAESTWAALQGRRALDVTWDEGKNAGESTAALTAEMKRLVAAGGRTVSEEGRVAEALDKAARRVDAEYEFPFVAHATMEPMNCTVDAKAGSCEVWAPTQSPGNARKAVAEALGLPEDKVTLHVTLLGGGFGRRLQTDDVVEAALLSRAAAAPVKVVWTREDDMQHDFYRPASFHRLAAGLDAAGNVVAWEHRIASPAILEYLEGPGFKNPEGAEMGGANLPPYRFPARRAAYALAASAVPRGWWRSVDHPHGCFATESFLDEVAAAAKVDPLELRLRLLGEPRKLESGEGPPFDTGRFKNVLETAARTAGWGQPLPAGRGRGIAAQFSFSSYVAEVAEVSVDAKGQLRLERIVCVADCGTVVNPDILTAQLEGGIVWGLTATLKSAITLDRGRVQQESFDSYPLLRMDETPKIEVQLVASTEPPTGAGEPGVPPVGPAVANAIFAATGKRVRKLPIEAALRG